MSYVFALGAIAYVAALLINPGEAARATNDGIALWATKVVPTLAPYFVGSLLLEKSGALHLLAKRCGGVCRAALKCPAAAFPAVLLSYASGFPAGARLIGALAADGTLTRSQGERAAIAASCASPGFVTGVAGLALLGGWRYAALLAVAHYAGAFINGVLWSIRVPKPARSAARAFAPLPFARALSEAIAQTGGAMLNIGVTIAVFTVVTRTVFYGNPIAACALEMTLGLSVVDGMTAGLAVKAALMAAVLSFGGLSVMFQSLPLLNGCVGPWRYILAKLGHSLISAVIAFAGCSLFMRDVPAFAHAYGVAAAWPWPAGYAAIAVCLAAVSYAKRREAI